MSVSHVNKQDFQKSVIEHKGVVLVDFYADWCGPCKFVAPIIDELAKEMTNVSFVKVNVDENQDLAGEYSVFSIPTFLVFKDGKVVDQFVGAQSKDQFKNKLETALAA